MPFICFTDTGHRLSFQEKNYAEAERYCKEQHKYIATVLNSNDNQNVMDVLQGKPVDEAWIGLRRDNWKWIDGNIYNFTHWGPNQPDNRNNNEACAIVTPEGTWKDTNCNEEHGFICQASRKETTVKLRMLTASDLRDPTNNNKVLEQLEAALRSRGFTDFNLLWRSLKLETQQTRTDTSGQEKKCEN
ncbi:C-type lectin lectoxin-Lio3 [Antennarius striatus]|uniref:C-type lectin lectoxin-Lio3 n=1 Tax=Antennarius striatus TaxID=241820 RepID=UPI0035B0E319